MYARDRSISAVWHSSSKVFTSRRNSGNNSRTFLSHRAYAVQRTRPVFYRMTPCNCSNRSIHSLDSEIAFWARMLFFLLPAKISSVVTRCRQCIPVCAHAHWSEWIDVELSDTNWSVERPIDRLTTWSVTNTKTACSVRRDRLSLPQVFDVHRELFNQSPL